MYTPIKPKIKVLNSSFSPFMSPSFSKVSTTCDLDRQQSNSISKKRFARKRQTSNQSLRRIKIPEFECKSIKNQQQLETENVQESSKKYESIVPQLNFRKDSIMTSKYVKISTDRSSHNENLPKNNNFLYNGSMTSRNYRNKTQQCDIDDIEDYKMELQIKSSEFMILEDENARMIKEIKAKQSQIQKLQRQKQQLSEQILKLRTIDCEKIQQLKNQLRQKDQQLANKVQIIQANEKALITVRENLKESQKQIQFLKMHLEQVITSQLSKQSIQLISYREVSLNNQLIQLRNDFELLKTEQHRNLQRELNKISQRLSSVTKDCQNLSIANRILSKKNQQLGISVQKKHKVQLIQIKDKLRTLMKETSTLKKENVTLRKTIHQHQKKTQPKNLNQRELLIIRPNRLQNGYKRSGQTSKQLESDDSFTISLSK